MNRNAKKAGIVPIDGTSLYMRTTLAVVFGSNSSSPAGTFSLRSSAIADNAVTTVELTTVLATFEAPAAKAM